MPCKRLSGQGQLNTMSLILNKKILQILLIVTAILSAPLFLYIVLYVAVNFSRLSEQSLRESCIFRQEKHCLSAMAK